MTALSPMAAQPVSPTPQPVPAQSGDRARRPETPAGPSLSPSRAADFKTCPLLFRFRTVDKLPETPSADQIRGTLVHAVLERLFDLPAADRTPEAAAALVTPEWEGLLAREPELAAVFATDPPPRGRPARPAAPASSAAPATGVVRAAPVVSPATSGSHTSADAAAGALHAATSGAADGSGPAATSSATPGHPTPADATGAPGHPTSADATTGVPGHPTSAHATTDAPDHPTSADATGAPSHPTSADATTGVPGHPTSAAADGRGFGEGAVTSAVGQGAAGSGAAGGESAAAAAAGGPMRDPAAVEAEIDATGQAALIDLPGGAAEAARIAAFLAGARDLLAGYFAVEDPRRLQPAERETLISTTIGDDLLLRGYIDRLDISPAGDMRVVDYKTGGAPREAFEGRALFQLKFYALVLWRARGVVPRALRLLYLKDAEALDYSPEAGELERFERTLIALSTAIERAKRDRDFRPKPSRLCGWCSHQALCPEFGGTPPPFPELPVTTSFTPDTEPDRVGALLRDDPLG